MCAPQIFFGPKKLWPEKILDQKKFWIKKMLEKYFGSQKKMQSPIKWDPKNLGPISLVKIGSVTAEILLIQTNVAWTYVAWTNVTMTVGIC